MAALNSDKSDISEKSSSLVDFTPLDTQLPMENILMLREALAGSCISTQPLADTHYTPPQSDTPHVVGGQR